MGSDSEHFNEFGFQDIENAFGFLRAFPGTADHECRLFFFFYV